MKFELNDTFYYLRHVSEKCDFDDLGAKASFFHSIIKGTFSIL
jgi:hypothetical protein